MMRVNNKKGVKVKKEQEIEIFQLLCAKQSVSPILKAKNEKVFKCTVHAVRKKYSSREKKAFGQRKKRSKTGRPLALSKSPI